MWSSQGAWLATVTNPDRWILKSPRSGSLGAIKTPKRGVTEQFVDCKTGVHGESPCTENPEPQRMIPSNSTIDHVFRLVTPGNRPWRPNDLPWGWIWMDQVNYELPGGMKIHQSQPSTSVKTCEHLISPGCGNDTCLTHTVHYCTTVPKLAAFWQCFGCSIWDGRPFHSLTLGVGHPIDVVKTRLSAAKRRWATSIFIGGAEVSLWPWLQIPSGKRLHNYMENHHF
jgi:hypothetical protein